MDKKETDGHEKEKGTGSEAKKMGNERMGENEEVCPFENILFCPGTTVLIQFIYSSRQWFSLSAIIFIIME